jgi:hypothetical protein
MASPASSPRWSWRRPYSSRSSPWPPAGSFPFPFHFHFHFHSHFSPCFHDLRYALRLLAKSPGFTAVAVLSLAVGIGVNSTLFSALDAAFLRPLPFKNADEIVRIDWPSFSYPEYEELRAALPSLSSLAAVGGHGSLLQGTERTEAFSSSVVSPDYFSTLGIAPAAGRLFSAEVDRSGQPGVVISYGLWQSRYGGDPHLVGQTITLDMRPVTVLGVAAQGLHGGAAYSGLRSVAAGRGATRHARSPQPQIPAAGPAQAGRDRRPSAGRNRTLCRPRHAGSDEDRRRPTRDGRAIRDGRHVPDAMPRGALVMAVVGLVLLVACANVSVLLLARHEGRRRELAVRLALGGSRWRLIRLLLVESTLLSLLGAAAGLLLTTWCIQLVPALLPPMMSAHVIDLRVDGRVLGLTLGLSCLATIAFGLLPAWRATRLDIGPLLKSDTSPALGGTRWFTLRNILVVGQVAVALVFLAVAALFIRGFGRGQQRDLGFTQKNLLLAAVGLMGGRERIADCEQLQEHLRALPGVRAVSLGTWAPLALSGDGATVRVLPPGAEASNTARANPSSRSPSNPAISPRSASRCSAGAISGRATTPPARAWRSSARRWRSTIGRVKIPWAKSFAPEMANSPHAKSSVSRAIWSTRIDPSAATEPRVYLPLRQEFRGDVRLLIATQHDPVEIAGLVRSEIRRFEDRLMLAGSDNDGRPAAHRVVSAMGGRVAGRRARVARVRARSQRTLRRGGLRGVAPDARTRHPPRARRPAGRHALARAATRADAWAWWVSASVCRWRWRPVSPCAASCSASLRPIPWR